MVTTDIRKLAVKAMVAGALGLGALGSAQATLVVGVWDPVYDNSNFPGLSWKGTVTVDVPSNCSTTAPANQAVGVSGICDPLIVVDAKVVFYATGDALEVPLDTLNYTATLNVTHIGFSAPNVAIGVRGTGPALLGNAATNLLGLYQAEFDLELDYVGTTPSVTLNWAVDPLLCAGPTPTLSVCGGSNVGEPRIVYSVVPEPLSMALAGTALLALGWTRRRRQS